MVNEKRLYIRHAAKELIPESMTHVLEFGVYKGASIKIIKNELAKKTVRYDLFGFDSFIGLPDDWVTPDGKTLLKEGAFFTGGPPDITGIKWFPGWFKDTIPEYLKIAQPIALLHVDCDLYVPAKEIFYGLQKFIVKGTIIAIDDWFYEKNPEYNDTTQKAFYEWVNDFNIKFKFHEFSKQHNSVRYGQKIVEVI